MSKHCPTSHKVPLTRAVAYLRADLLARRKNREVEPYLCPCGRWHLRTVRDRPNE